MSSSSNTVSLHPYFKVHAGQLANAKALLPAFVAKTQSEPDCLFYEFTINGDVVFCREAYRGGAATLAHLTNVSELLQKMLAISDVMRLEVHGPAAELEVLREPLAAFDAQWFVLECGLKR